MTSPIILALDTKDPKEAANWIRACAAQIDHFKIGLEYFLENGKASILDLQKEFDFHLFLDLKFYDIPNTVKGAVESVSELNPKFLTVHAAGGAEMIKSAVSVLPGGSITAVTVLTSFSDTEFMHLGYTKDISQTASIWASQAVAAGATSLVCSPFEAALMRQIAPKATIITPGVRLAGEKLNDQSRVMSPKQALENGADYVVIGRSITSEAANGVGAMQDKIAQILESINP